MLHFGRPAGGHCLADSRYPALAAQLTLTWTDNASNESGFRVERRLNPRGSYSEIATLGPNVTTYADTTVTAGQGYGYRVRAYNSAGNSGYTIEACGTVAPVPTVILTVTKAGTGTVTSTMPSNAINCGADCSETALSGTPITLAAAPGAGFTSPAGAAAAPPAPVPAPSPAPRTPVTATLPLAGLSFPV
jgi:hypothetical protein